MKTVFLVHQFDTRDFYSKSDDVISAHATRERAEEHARGLVESRRAVAGVVAEFFPDGPPDWDTEGYYVEEMAVN